MKAAAGVYVQRWIRAEADQGLKVARVSLSNKNCKYWSENQNKADTKESKCPPKSTNLTVYALSLRVTIKYILVI